MATLLLPRPSQALLEGDKQASPQRQVALPIKHEHIIVKSRSHIPVPRREHRKDQGGVWGPCVPPCQASFLLPGSPSAGSCTSRPHPVPMAKKRRTHLLLVFMVMPLHWVFQYGDSRCFLDLAIFRPHSSPGGEKGSPVSALYPQVLSLFLLSPSQSGL